MKKEQKNQNPVRQANTKANLERFYEYIKGYIESNGFPPTIREMSTVMDNCSTSTVFYYLLKLEKQKLITRRFGKNRAIEVPALTNSKSIATVAIPLIGTIAAGTPIMAEQNIEETFYLPENLFKRGELFMLTVKGDSMINAGINNGDKVVIRQQNTASNGEIVAAMIDGSATVKRFYREASQFRLKPENDRLKDIIVKDLDILGIVVGLIRSY